MSTMNTTDDDLRPYEPGVTSFIDDAIFLQRRTSVIILSDEDGAAQIALAPEYQGRVMTSTAGGDEGLSFGWINRRLIASGERRPHINPFGGEDRFWLGPEGGQFSIFFRHGDPFDLAHWQTPAPIDWGAWDALDVGPRHAHFRRVFSVDKRSGAAFHVEVNRRVKLLDRAEVSRFLAVELPSKLAVVGFESDNSLTNRGDQPWEKATGLLSIWILGMFHPSPATTVVLPFRAGPDDRGRPIVNDAYFGKVPRGRLAVRARRGLVFFRADGNHRCKIGLDRHRARPVAGSYDAEYEVLTIVQFTMPPDAVDYVNSLWRWQEDPYAGDVVNSYNDGPAEPGAEPLGPFYELETSSPALALRPGETGRHVHRTIHVQGAAGELDRVASAVLGASLDEIAGALK
jgi:hypothetical protein